MFEDKIVITKIVSVLLDDSGRTSRFHDYSGNIPHNELIFKLGGTSRIKFDSDEILAVEGTVRFLPERNRKTKYTVEVIESGKYIDIFFDTLTPINESALYTQPQNRERIAKLFVRAENAWRKKQLGYENTALGCLYEIIGLLQHENAYLPYEKAKKIRTAIDYISEHFIDETTVDELANMCGISHTYFKRIFKDMFGTTPKAYMIGLRIKHAKELLATGKYKITDIAQMCGYRNVYYFSRSFKEVTGISPSEYASRF